MSRRIFFFHNPKAGGTSLRKAIETCLPDSKRCPIIENDKVDHDELAGAYAQHRGYDIYAGHYGRDIFAAVSDGHDCITNFRHPVSRLLSLYNFFRHVVVLDDAQRCETRFRAVTLAKTAGLREFVASDDPHVDVYLRDQHFRQLTHSCWSLDDRGDFDEACRLVDAMPCYYVCEFPELSQAWMREMLALEDIPLLNVTGHTEEAVSGAALDDETCRLICAKNQRDIALYAHAVARLMRFGCTVPALLGTALPQASSRWLARNLREMLEHPHIPLLPGWRGRRRSHSADDGADELSRRGESTASSSDLLMK